MALVAVCFLAAGCNPAGNGAGPGTGREVVVYTSVDQPYSEPVLETFEKVSGIKVLAVYDVEATKTTGLANRLLAEKDRPRADVWWNGEFAQTIDLADAGVFAPYSPPNAEGLPRTMIDADGMWSGFGGRARALIINTEALTPEQYPSSILDLAEPSVAPDLVGMAYPLFGTTATHAAALYALWGADSALDYYHQLSEQGIRVVDGNSVVRDLVASGQLAYGITDTDDACGAVERGDPVALVLPDQAEGEIGTLVIPNTVALVKGGPNTPEGRQLVDYLLSPDVESSLVESGWFHVSHRQAMGPSDCLDAGNVRAMDVTLVEIAARMEQAKTELGDVFLR